jgi:hypothetical protein
VRDVRPQFSLSDTDSRTRDDSEPAAILSSVLGAASVFFIYPLELLSACMAFYTIHSSSGEPIRPSCLRTACIIHAEGSPRLPLPSPPTSAPTTPVPRDFFDTFPFLEFYHGLTAGLAGMVPYADTAFLVGIPTRRPGLCRGGRLPSARDAFGRSQVGG